MRRELDTTAVDFGNPFVPIRGRQISDGDSLLAQKRVELCNGRHIAWRSHDDCRTSEKGWDNLFNGDIKRQRCELQDAIALPKLVANGSRDGMICQRAVGDDYALRLAGRAG